MSETTLECWLIHLIYCVWALPKDVDDRVKIYCRSHTYLENYNHKLHENTITKANSLDLKQAETSLHDETDDSVTANGDQW